MILQINPNHPQPRLIDQVVKSLKQGNLIAYPTDTTYGIGCDIHNKNAVEKLHKLVKEIKESAEEEEDEEEKVIKKHSPLSFICKDLSNIADYAQVENNSYRTMKRCLPGPYTFILEASKLVPKVMLNKRKTIGIRVPDNPIAIAIVEALGNPIANTSAADDEGNLLADPWTINDLFKNHLDIVIDGGHLFPSPSTIVDFTSGETVVVREGKGPVDHL